MGEMCLSEKAEAAAAGHMRSTPVAISAANRHCFRCVRREYVGMPSLLIVSASRSFRVRPSGRDIRRLRQRADLHSSLRAELVGQRMPTSRSPAACEI